jgi:inner membrane protein involved in colicin E2 resistance
VRLDDKKMHYCMYVVVGLWLQVYDCTLIAVHFIERTGHDYTHYIPDTDCSIHSGLLFCGRLNAL